jgi:hypothetical protein
MTAQLLLIPLADDVLDDTSATTMPITGRNHVAQVAPPLRAAAKPEFDWLPDNPDILMPDQRATAVYLNPWQQVCIRQERAWDEDDDPYLCISVEHVPALIERLQAVMREARRP